MTTFQKPLCARRSGETGGVRLTFAFRSYVKIDGRYPPTAKRNKIINRLNERKAHIMHSFPDGKYALWAERHLQRFNSNPKSYEEKHLQQNETKHRNKH